MGSSMVELHSVELMITHPWRPANIALLEVPDPDSFMNSGLWSELQSFQGAQGTGQELALLLDEV